jgi:hypothetical protein
MPLLTDNYVTHGAADTYIDTGVNENSGFEELKTHSLGFWASKVRLNLKGNNEHIAGRFDLVVKEIGGINQIKI